MPFARALVDQRLDVAPGAVALVAGESVGWIAVVELCTDPIAGHLGDDAGCGDRGADRVAVDDRPLREIDLAQAESVDHQVVGHRAQMAERLAHGELGGLQDVDAVDHLDLHAANADPLRPVEDQLVERLAPSLR